MSVDSVINKLHKKYGLESVSRMGQAPNQAISAIPTGCLALDLAIGVGGVPRGRITEMYGPPEAGKTTIALHIVAECQKMGGDVLYVDMEHALDPRYMKIIGIDVDNLILSQPDCAETALSIAEEFIRENVVWLVVIDSVASLTPRAAIEGAIGDANVGLRARILSQAIARLVAPIKSGQVAVIFINQLRAKIGGFGGGFGWETTSTPGGYALKHHSKVRIDVRRIGSEKDSAGERISNRTRATVKKNQVAKPYEAAEFEIVFDEGISRPRDLVDMGIKHGVVEQRGAYYYYVADDELRLGQGWANTKENLESNPSLMLEIENQVRRKVGLPIKLEK